MTVASALPSGENTTSRKWASCTRLATSRNSGQSQFQNRMITAPFWYGLNNETAHGFPASVRQLRKSSAFRLLALEILEQLAQLLWNGLRDHLVEQGLEVAPDVLVHG